MYSTHQHNIQLSYPFLDRDLCRAQYVMQKFKEYGIKTHMTSYDVLLSYPLKRELHMLAPIEFSPLLRESVKEEVPQSRSTKEVDTFLAYAKSGGFTLFSR